MNGLIKTKWKREDSGLPLYQQIVDFFTKSIENGDIPPGYVLPGHRTLAVLFDVSINTILYALSILRKNKMIYVSPRSKAVVSKHIASKPDWDKYISTSLYNPTHNEFFCFAENHVGSLNLSMGLDKDYYFRELYNDVLPKITIPPTLVTSPFGLPALRDAICTFMQKYSIHAMQEEIMIVTSVFHALNVLFIGLLGRGTNLIVPKPCNLSISNLVRTTGSNIVSLPVDDEGIIIHNLAKEARTLSNSILCISPDLNLPTGTITSLKRRQEILDVCTKHKIPIIEHTLFPFGCNLNNTPSLKAMDKENIVIHVSQIGATGSTNPWLGWMIADEYLLKRLNNIRFNLDAHQNYLTQVATLATFESGRYSAYLERIAATRKKREMEVSILLNKHLSSLAEWNKENIDASVWLKFNKGINTFNMYKNARNITFQPGRFYDENDTEHVFLYPVALSMENFEFGLHELATLANSMAPCLERVE